MILMNEFAYNSSLCKEWWHNSGLELWQTVWDHGSAKEAPPKTGQSVNFIYWMSQECQLFPTEPQIQPKIGCTFTYGCAELMDRQE